MMFDRNAAFSQLLFEIIDIESGGKINGVPPSFSCDASTATRQRLVVLESTVQDQYRISRLVQMVEGKITCLFLDACVITADKYPSAAILMA